MAMSSRTCFFSLSKFNHIRQKGRRNDEEVVEDIYPSNSEFYQSLLCEQRENNTDEKVAEPPKKIDKENCQEEQDVILGKTKDTESGLNNEKE